MSKSSQKKYGPPTPADEVASHLRRRGFDLDPRRLEENVAAKRSRKKREFDQYRDRVESLALAVKRARRRCEFEEWEWRRNPNSTTLQAAKEAQAARNSMYKELLEACLQDQDLASRLGR